MPSNEGGNPFTLKPIRDPGLFIGRDSIIDACCSSFERRTRAISVVGLPGSGKTSLLYQIANRGAQRPNVSSDRAFLPIYFDCHKIPDPQAFMLHVFEEITRLWPACPTDGFDLPITDQTDLQYFLADLPRKAVLLLDNICSMARNPAFSFEFFSYLRGIAIDIDIDIPMITTSCQRLDECVPKSIAASEFPNIFSATPLPPLSVQELEGMLQAQASRSGVSLMPYRDEIAALSGRIPFLVQMACSLYYEALCEGSGTLTGEQRATIGNQLATSAHPYFQRIWEVLPSQARACSQQLAQGRGLTLNSAESTQLTNVGFLQEERLFCEPFAEFAAQMAPA